MKNRFLPVLFSGLVASTPATAAESAQDLAGRIAGLMQSQLPVQLESGATIVDVKSQGGTLTIKYQFGTQSGPDDETAKRRLAHDMCGHRGTISALTDAGGTVVAILEYKDRTIITSLTGANCKPSANFMATREALRKLLAGLKFPYRISDSSSLTGGRLGNGLELSLVVEENLSRAEAERSKASPETARWIAMRQQEVCRMTHFRPYLEGGVTITYRHEAHGFVIAEVRVDKLICRI